MEEIFLIIFLPLVTTSQMGSQEYGDWTTSFDWEKATRDVFTRQGRKV
jgi:hypothetical protein